MLTSSLWIPITLWAALAQTLRNLAQRQLTAELGTWGATLVRFLYGLPFALGWWYLVASWQDASWMPMTGCFLGWVTLGAVSQIIATACLLQAMQVRGFALAIAYSKTEIVQVASFGYLCFGDSVGVLGTLGVIVATLGVLLLSPADVQRPLQALAVGWMSRSALLGLGAGAGFALASVSFRGAALQLQSATSAPAAAQALLVALTLQTLLLGTYLLIRSPAVIVAVLRAWRASLWAGCMGSAASAGWFTAFALTTAAQVRTLGVVEVLFSYAISRRWLHERPSRSETAGMLLLASGLVLIVVRG